MIFSENRSPLFKIMLYRRTALVAKASWTGCWTRSSTTAATAAITMAAAQASKKAFMGKAPQLFRIRQVYTKQLAADNHVLSRAGACARKARL